MLKICVYLRHLRSAYLVKIKTYLKILMRSSNG